MIAMAGPAALATLWRLSAIALLCAGMLHASAPAPAGAAACQDPALGCASGDASAAARSAAGPGLAPAQAPSPVEPVLWDWRRYVENRWKLLALSAAAAMLAFAGAAIYVSLRLKAAEDALALFASAAASAGDDGASRQAPSAGPGKSWGAAQFARSGAAQASSDDDKLVDANRRKLADVMAIGAALDALASDLSRLKEKAGSQAGADPPDAQSEQNRQASSKINSLFSQFREIDEIVLRVRGEMEKVASLLSHRIGAGAKRRRWRRGWFP